MSDLNKLNNSSLVVLTDRIYNMTKKDYELLANSIKGFRYEFTNLTGNEIDQDTLNLLVGWLSSDLANDNPRFNTDKFISATL